MAAGVPITTATGIFTAYFSETGLAQLDFPGSAIGQRAAAELREAPSAEIEGWRKVTAQALESTLSGRSPDALPPLDWTGSTEFQRSVWEALLTIGPGQTRTYAEIAAAIGKPGAARAVGSACGSNPIPVLVPCHRVVAANGKLGGFSGGLVWKRRLLALESPSIFG